MTAGEAFLVPRSLLESHSSFANPFVALFASLSEVLGEAEFAIDFSIARNETVVHNQLVTFAALETVLVEFLFPKFVLFHARAKHLSAGVTSGGEVVVVTIGAEKFIVDCSEFFATERRTTVRANETLLMPMLILIRQILSTGANNCLALGTYVGE